MVQIKVKAGALLNVNLLGVKLKIPPIDIVFFDTNWLLAPIQHLILTIPILVWNMFKDILDDLAASYYEDHEEEE